MTIKARFGQGINMATTNQPIRASDLIEKPFGFSSQKPDISNKVLSLAREIDRLPPGEYSITLVKPSSKHQQWQVQIDRKETIREMNIPAQIIQRHGEKL